MEGSGPTGGRTEWWRQKNGRDLKIKYLTELEEMEGGNFVFKDQKKNQNYIIGRDLEEELTPGLRVWGMKRSNDL